ncbi:MAG: MFS transporter [Bacteroidota bacterium]
MEKVKLHILPIIILSQFAATSLWFAGNAIYPTLQTELGFSFEIAPQLTIAVQLGFILGTLLYAIFMIADRFSPSKVFLVSAILAALANMLILIPMPFWGIYASRLLTGFFLAGIYPVGMKIASDWFPRKLGNALGFLVAALVLGTSFPHLIRFYSMDLPWKVVIITTSVIAVSGGLATAFLVGDGPHRKVSKQFSFSVFFKMFSNKMFNRASFGYFGHMWELYAFWAFLPAILTYISEQNEQYLNVSIWSFAIVAVGGVGSAVGGLYAKRFGSCRVAFFSMLMSALCALSFLFMANLSINVIMALLFVWGFFVVADSPQFSSVIADYADKTLLGSALTIVNCIGFLITILSIELMERLASMGPTRFWILAIGPLLGLIPTGKIAFRKNFPAL